MQASSRKGFLLIFKNPHSFPLPLCSHFIIVHQGLPHFAISSKALDRPSADVTSSPMCTSIVQPSIYDHQTITSRYVPNTIVHPRAPTCKERSIERPRYASASTFVIGSPSSFSFSVARMLFAHIGYTGNCRACRPSSGCSLPLWNGVGFLSVTYLYPRDTMWIPLALSRSLAERLINPGLSLNPGREPRTGVRSINDFWYKLSAVLRPQTTVHYIVGAVGVHGPD